MEQNKGNEIIEKFVNKGKQQQIEQLQSVESLLSQSWLMLYNIDDSIEGDIAEIRFALNNVQCKLLDLTSKLKA